MIPENKSSLSDADIIKQAKKRFSLAQDATSDIRREAVEDLKFRSGDQWPDDIKTQRAIEKRPCLTINRLPQFLRQITNDQRQNRPAIKVSPIDDNASVETAKVLQGLIRHIEVRSNAEVAYDTAFDGAATNGFGFFRILTEYPNPATFDEEISIKRIRDPFTVFFDPSSQEPDGSDANWCLIVEDWSREDFEAEFPGAELSQMDDWHSIGSSISEDWVTKDGCRVAEYFYKTFEKITLCRLSTGEAIDKSLLPEILPDGIEIKDEREALKPEVHWVKINGLEVLDKTVFRSEFIPVIPVYGDEIIVEGKRILEGVIRHARDPQRMYNLWKSAEAEMITLAPKAPFIGAEGQFEGHEGEWRTANTKSHAFLQYKAKDIGGSPLPPPQRNMVEPPVQAISNASQMAAEELKATTGIYDASLGNKSNEQSGVAIQRRNSQSAVSNYHFSDNFNRSLRHTGRILLDLIPEVYDQAQAIRIIGDDGQEDIVAINQMFQKAGEKKIHDLKKGNYDVTISTGPSYQTKRQEAVASMLELTRAYPQIAQIAGDLLVQNMDWPGAQEIAARLRKTLPPGVADDPQNGPPVPPQVQAQMNQMRGVLQQLTQQLNQAHDIIDKKKLEIDSHERIAFAKMETDLKREMLKMEADHAKTAFQQEIKHIHKKMDLTQVTDPDFNKLAGTPSGLASEGQPATGGTPPGQPMGVP